MYSKAYFGHPKKSILLLNLKLEGSSAVTQKTCTFNTKKHAYHWITFCIAV